MSFRREAIAFIKSRAAQTVGGKDFEIVHLAAYLFAIGSQLQLSHGSARFLTRFHVEPPPVASSLNGLLRQLADLPATTDATTLYWTLVSALTVIEDEICRHPAYRLALPASTRLDGFPAGKFRGLSGRVLHWIRPPSELALKRSTRYEHARKRAPAPIFQPETYLKRLAMYWDSDPQLPEVVHVKPGVRTFRLFEQSGRDATERRRFRVALCPLAGCFHPLFKILPTGRHFQTLPHSGTAHWKDLHEHLKALVEAAVAEEVSLLVLPELSIDEDSRNRLRDLLQQTLSATGSTLYVLAGSFHIWRELEDEDEDEDEEEARPVNEAVLLDPTGEVSARHWKKGRFRITSAQVNAAPHFFPLRPAEIAREIFEDIHYGSKIQVLDTSLGRLAFLICADAIAADPKGYLPVVRSLRPDLLFVVSMTPETQPFDAFAEDMRRHWIGTLFVNAHCICDRKPISKSWSRRLRRAAFSLLGTVGNRFGLQVLWGEDTAPNLAACDLALHEHQGTPPTRTRWRYGKEAECIYYDPADRNRSWRPLSQALGPTGLAWLTKGTEKLGCIVDLGVHFEKTEREE